jgi:two-component system chemotaxis response regulator CheB
LSEFRIAIADARPVRARRLAALIRSLPGFALIGSCSTLMAAYSLIEAEVPDAVLTSEALQSQAEHEMYYEMMRLLGVRALSLESVVPERTDDQATTAALLALREATKQRDLASRRTCIGGNGAVERGAVGPVSTALASVIVIGASTGGVEALHRVLSHFPADCPATLIVQHIRGAFSGAFAGRLNRACAAEVLEAAPGLPLARGRVLVAPGAEAHLVIGGPPPLVCRLVASEPMTGHRPSVDMLFGSAVPLGNRAIGVLLTGMGQDGARGLLALRKAGAHTIAQDRATSTVYGMPKVAAEIGAATEVLPLDAIATAAIRAADRAASSRRASSFVTGTAPEDRA